MLRKTLVRMLVAMGLCGSLLGIAAAQDTSGAALVFPRFGPGVAGNVMVGPILPVCRPDVPCEKPLAGASVEIIGLSRDLLKQVIGTAVTNDFGNFIVSVPPGDYLVHVETGVFPQCEEVKVTVDKKAFAFVAVDCDTGLR